MLEEYREVFLEELQEQLELMDDEILKLEKSDHPDQVIQDLFRAAHTLKGSSAAMGFDEMKRLTHEMEHLLDQVRNKKMEVRPDLIDLLFKSLDCLKQLKQDIEEHTSARTDISETILELQRFSQVKEPYGETSDTIHTESALAPGTPSEANEASEDPGTSSAIRRIIIELAADCQIKGARAYLVHAKLKEWGEVLRCEPDLKTLEEGHDAALQSIEMLYVGSLTDRELEERVSGLSEVCGVTVQAYVAAEEAAAELADCAVESDSAWRGPKPRGEELQTGSVTKSPTIRVSVERLEHLMNLVGELVIDQTRVHQVKKTLGARYSDDAVEDLEQIADHLTRVIADLQDSVMKARMLPIEQLFNRFPRMIRDLSRELRKDIELLIEGKETELDRTLIEEIADPLIHLIRNAVDHGIEPAAKREQQGKNRKGLLRISAAHEDNQIVICVEDDGGGIDPARMIRSAIQKGILTEEEAETLSDRDAVELIFRPGFSTAQTVSDVSGRGVGMDIVKSHIQKLNGLIDIETVVGKGTRFKIKLPLTLAIITGLTVKLQEQSFIIPMNHIAEIVRSMPNDIRTVRGQEVMLLREQVIPVVWLHELLGIERAAEERSHLPVVIVGLAEKRMAFVVDELLGNQEIVIKSLGTYIGKVEEIAGAAILGDGGVALILNIAGLLAKLERK